MAKITFKLEGFETLQAAIVRSPDLVRVHATDVVQRSTFATAQRMKSAAPVRTGALRNAITPAARGLSGRVLIGSAGFYWRFVEYGTVNMPARPFVRASAEMESLSFIASMRAIGPKLERDWSAGRFI